jgi:hypothetical protein
MTYPMTRTILRQLATRLAVDGERDQPVRSQFELLAEAATPSGPDEVLGIMLAAACLPPTPEHWTRRPIWAEEAMHRACNMLRLVQSMRGDGSAASWRHRPVLARHLAGCFAALADCCEHQVVPVSQLLRDVAHDLGSLFAPAYCDIAVTTRIERMVLPACQRRALVLATTELVTNALLHAFPGQSGGRIEVTLHRVGERRASLRVADSGIGIGDGHAYDCGSVTGGLAEALGARLRYFGTRAWPTVADVTFPARIVLAG